ncbi:hypothetical protein B0H63DRAFT_475769 [Podospora didyma]|uniref:Uncharacterized protein n=1 Tax=Podospora didyma TaxID=330526 RepID=A0AAE0NHA1_9PEZI|nr:hypothetical protein B0H63DRAFT_475769 [Podospora didyma]
MQGLGGLAKIHELTTHNLLVCLYVCLFQPPKSMPSLFFFLFFYYPQTSLIFGTHLFVTAPTRSHHINPPPPHLDVMLQLGRAVLSVGYLCQIPHRGVSPAVLEGKWFHFSPLCCWYGCCCCLLGLVGSLKTQPVRQGR